MKRNSGNRIHYRISGMTCRNCEKKLESKIGSHPAVTGCRADYVKGSLKVDFKDGENIPPDIPEHISQAGYEGRVTNLRERILREVLPLGTGAVLILMLYWAGESTGLINRIPEIREDTGYSLLFLIGLLTSLHCVGMCGGINLSQTGSRQGEKSGLPTVKRSLQYNLGRIISYTLLGGLVGGIGSILYLSLAMQAFIIIGAGIIMVIMGLNMVGLLSPLRILVPLLPEALSEKFRKIPLKRSPFAIGLLNGFMPCGPLQSMQVYALSTGSIVRGALSMFLFSTGTVPLMFAFGTLSALFTGRFQRNVMRLSALLIIILGTAMISRGLRLSGIEILTQEEGISAPYAAVAELRGAYQTVSSAVTPSAYEPIVVQAGIPVKWTLEAGPGDITGCNKAILSRAFGIRQNLSEGATLVEFTPEETGTFGFTCWMGMIDSRILVVEDLTAFDPELLNAPAESSRESVEIRIPEFREGDIGYTRISDGLQTALLHIDGKGFSPAILIMEKGLKTTWEFEAGAIGDREKGLLFPAYNARIDLEPDSSQTIELTPSGDFYFYSWQGDYLGFVIVTERGENLSAGDILARVETYLNR